MDKSNNSVADHYNKIKSISLCNREVSQIIGVREVNNFLKQRLIQKFIQQNSVVLDLGCGKGGDLSKLKHCPVRTYYGCDIAQDSLKEALSRSIGLKFKTHFLNANFASDKITIEEKADLVMSQFSFHYAFSSELSMKKAAMNVFNNLKEGGVFILTIPDTNVILRRSERNAVDGSFGNRLYKVVPSPSFYTEKSFGRGYKFYLQEALTGCEEYLTNMEYLTEFFKSKGMVKIFDTDFLSFINTEMFADKEMYSRMVKRVLTQEELPIIELYRAIAYKKN
ncbi:mRNA (guanine-N7-)-methyltransferase [Nematocida ausubeli]|nr:mRNA (guanine-N7-)-methyltransferase [Nematocida ausubeli]KAI5135642.1 mRNA (guanine-N7-)-methyltransferase [Nematocida ausubeli]KAI5146581.1 mRNA (guanine-N7-)-methyltransferase [Nematocida ausubeli]KAI5162920.1 mRNA (guanine-N7-)-methyltransferase [Nematocida ausubeli]